MKAPRYWQKRGFVSTLVIPLSWLYQLFGLVRALITRPYRADLPVICVGNITSGGTGKHLLAPIWRMLQLQKAWRL